MLASETSKSNQTNKNVGTERFPVDGCVSRNPLFLNHAGDRSPAAKRGDLLRDLDDDSGEDSVLLLASPKKRPGLLADVGVTETAPSMFAWYCLGSLGLRPFGWIILSGTVYTGTL